MAETSPPTTENNKQHLLYFFIGGDRLEELYNKLFTEKKLNIPVSLGYSHDCNNINKTTEMYKVIEPGIMKHLIFDIDIKMSEGELKSFGSIIYSNNTDKLSLNSIISRNGLGCLFADTIKKVNEYYLTRLNKSLNPEKNNINCDIKCRFFNINFKDERTRDIYHIENKDIFDKYERQITLDKGNINTVFIADDLLTDEFADYFLLNGLLETSNPPKIILLPCLHNIKNKNACSYNNDGISENCRMFNNTDIDTKLYTDFYGDDIVRRPSYLYYTSTRRHCRDTNIISLVLNNFYTNTPINRNRIDENLGGRRKKSTKKQKKMRKTNKKSRKTRKHKKLRKH